MVKAEWIKYQSVPNIFGFYSKENTEIWGPVEISKGNTIITLYLAYFFLCNN